ncbi:hypothetical protein SAPIO_CDS8473 [Scedosporium apiospermum]|uniref:Uncharacterized protein n=1 Tax=Pseudallescheria apiosperma TaxID=563466 RepID=A0A084FZP9_PSEDA|nr:uncharacterized protein SAPIO_CDS8473 [Scedosporium apiospermum]KEZ40561.1 hypothetical protein SAPIO_CDS8473 [Scedosporium apiospermum]
MKIQTLAFLAVLSASAVAVPVGTNTLISTFAVDADVVPKGYSIECRSEAGVKLCKESDEAREFLQCRGNGEITGVEGSRFEYCARDCQCLTLNGACGNRSTC